MDIELINIIDTITVDETFTPEEEVDIIDTAFSLICDLINLEPMLYIQPYFHESIILEVTELILEQLSDSITYDIEDEVTLCVEQAMKQFYRHVAPKRCNGKTFIRIKPNRNTITEKINYLKNIPQPDQRTDEWYNFRYRFLTASSIWKAFISESTKNQLIYDKCKPLNLEKYSHTSTDSPMHWGHKYEPVSIKIYELLYETSVSDFGCIPHRTLSFLAASPDGINTLDTSDRYGRMLEIKNIVNRDIDGNPKMEYWIQMQLQMEVCNLNECDFLETRFKEYIDEAEYMEDSEHMEDSYNMEDSEHMEDSFVNINKTKDGQQKGIMIQFIVNGQPKYEYSPLNISKEKFTIWEEEMMNKHENDMWVKNIYWRLDELSCVLVLRNKLWFNHAVPILTDIWKTIEYEKEHGYEHRSPNKKVKLDKGITVIKTSNSNFCFDMNNLIDANSIEINIDTEMLC